MLKKEVRILGISASESQENRPIIGVIFRGSLWLDGVLTHTLQTSGKRYISELAGAIRKSKQYSQIHAAVFSREDILPRGRDDFRKLARMIRFPIFVLKSRGKRRRRRSSGEMWQVGSISVWSPNSKPGDVRQLFMVSCADGQSIPEAVRTADLIAKHVAIQRRQVTLKSKPRRLA